jgi:hypothetical protein
MRVVVRSRMCSTRVRLVRSLPVFAWSSHTQSAAAHSAATKTFGRTLVPRFATTAPSPCTTPPTRSWLRPPCHSRGCYRDAWPVHAMWLAACGRDAVSDPAASPSLTPEETSTKIPAEAAASRLQLEAHAAGDPHRLLRQQERSITTSCQALDLGSSRGFARRRRPDRSTVHTHSSCTAVATPGRGGPVVLRSDVASVPPDRVSERRPPTRPLSFESSRLANRDEHPAGRSSAGAKVEPACHFHCGVGAPPLDPHRRAI